MADYKDRITEKFIGKNIFITGGSGFIGKILIEKILRLCPDVGCIYLLIRPKKGKDPQTRIKELFADALYDKIRSSNSPEFFTNKSKLIEGDIRTINLGIKPEDRRFLIENIDYIYHIAATVRFDEPLKSALLMNTRGTKFMLELAKECKNLQIFCFVSTAYAHPNEKILEERVYPPAADPHKTIETLENLSADVVDSMTPTILGNLPNTYTFTKSLSESLVMEQMDNLPIIMARPSVVVPVWKDPLPGWGQNVNGPMGLLIGAGKGIVRSMYCNGDTYADFVPVDILANALCICTWDYLSHKDRRIYNLTTSDEIHYSWNELINTGRKVVTTTTPFNTVMWYPGGGPRKCKVSHYISVVLFQIIPAIFVDILLYFLGYKPILVNIQKRILKGNELLQFYTTNQWNFVKANFIKSRELMNPVERQKYYIDKENFKLDDYLDKAVLGARRFILKETDDTLPAARRHIKIMWFIDRLVKILITLGFFYLLYKYFYLSVF